MPSTSTAIVSSSSFAQSQRTGREKRSPPASQTIDLRNASPRTIAVHALGKLSRRCRPGTLDAEEAVAHARARRPRRRASSRTRRAALLAQVLRRALDPLVGASARARRRRAPPAAAARRSSSARRRAAQPALGQLRLRLAAGGRGQLLAADLKQQRRHRPPTVELGDGAREVADAADVRGALGHGDRAARVEQVERVRALQHLVVGRQRQPPLDAARGTRPRARAKRRMSTSTGACSKL